MRRPLIPLVALLVGVLALLLWLRRPDPATAPAATAPPAPAASNVASASIENPKSNIENSSERSRLADALNAPAGDIRRDLQILQEVFGAWQTNFPRDGNPVGDNAEITAALTGRNRLQLALIPRDHPAINARGELCDRWGTPFFFHQLGGTRMEIRSAGPDRVLHTADDVVFPSP